MQGVIISTSGILVRAMIVMNQSVSAKMLPPMYCIGFEHAPSKYINLEKRTTY